jgi:large subunit ribosomal protein L18
VATVAQLRRQARIRRHGRVRRKISGTAERPRLAIFRSAKHIYAQVIDDVRGVTLAAASTVEPGLSEGLETTSNMAAAKVVGTAVAQRAAAVDVTNAVVDRGGHLYHGRVSALADAAREAGLDLGPSRRPKNRGVVEEPAEDSAGEGDQQQKSA